MCGKQSVCVCPILELRTTLQRRQHLLSKSSSFSSQQPFISWFGVHLTLSPSVPWCRDRYPASFSTSSFCNTRGTSTGLGLIQPVLVVCTTVYNWWERDLLPHHDLLSCWKLTHFLAWIISQKLAGCTMTLFLVAL